MEVAKGWGGNVGGIVSRFDGLQSVADGEGCAKGAIAHEPGMGQVANGFIEDYLRAQPSFAAQIGAPRVRRTAHRCQLSRHQARNLPAARSARPNRGR